MKIKHVLIIGLGHIAKRHIKIIRQINPEIKISAVSKRKNILIKDEYDIDLNSIYNDLGEAPLNSIDLAIICSPATSHISDASILMNHNINTLIEKPISVSSEGLDGFLNNQIKSKSIMTVGYVLRHRPDFQYFHDLIRQIDLSSIKKIEVKASSYLPEWRPNRDYKTTVSADTNKGGGVLLELSHEFDYINYFFGPILSVSCKLINTGLLEIKAEEQANLVLENKHKFPIEVHLDFISKEASRFCKITTKDEIYKCDFIDKSVEVKDNREIKVYKKFDFDFDNIYMLQLKEFLKSIENNEPVAVTLFEAIEVMKIIDAAKKSAIENKIVVINSLEL